jgi:hypothetical protein
MMWSTHSTEPRSEHGGAMLNTLSQPVPEYPIAVTTKARSAGPRSEDRQLRVVRELDTVTLPSFAERRFRPDCARSGFTM